MLRLASVFFVWIASTANCELVGTGCYALVAQERAAELRHVLTNTNVRTIIGHGGVDPERSEDELRTDLGTDER